MAANVYEFMVLFDSNKYASNREALIEQLHNTLQKHNCTVLVSRHWDERRLAYPIRHHKKGAYYLVYFQAEGKDIEPLQEDIRLNESILRTLLLRIHPKLVDAMLAMARDEHAYALQAPGLAEEVAGAATTTETEAGT